MPLTTLAYRATIGLIWALALWHSWISRGLFVDGSAFLLNIVRHVWFFDFYPPRLYAMIAAQVPIMTAVTVGVTDLHLLARLLSLGLFALPTFFYTLALVRARHDAVLLAVVIAAIGSIFMTTSFFIVGEYNSAYAMAILVAVRLVTARKLTPGDGLALLAIAAMSIRTYEVFIYLGPLLAAMTLWQVWRMPRRPIVPALLHLAAAACFIAAMAVAIDSVVHPYSAEHLAETYFMALNFWQNMQFDLAFIPVATVAIWALVRPEHLATMRPYRWAGICIVLLALSPLLALGDTMVRPLAKSQYVARTVGGVIIAAMVAFVWCYGAERLGAWRVRVVLQDKSTRRRVLVLACLILVAVLPSDIFLSLTWQSFLKSFREVVTSHRGLVAYETTPLAHPPDLLMVENWTISTQSLILRSRPGDGIVLPPRSFTDWVPFPPDNPPNIGRFAWRD
ncbi:hypothetical protein [Reyranella sp.]|jgi:hypothetical protein|uniref:hypothetical protein n=1 Tax=Reyranella sp. TaxID=1929291 RepID=UPI002F91DD5B